MLDGVVGRVTGVQETVIGWVFARPHVLRLRGVGVPAVPLGREEEAASVGRVKHLWIGVIAADEDDQIIESGRVSDLHRHRIVTRGGEPLMHVLPSLRRGCRHQQNSRRA